MTIDKFIKLANGTREEFVIACTLLVKSCDPLEFLREHANNKSSSTLEQLILGLGAPSEKISEHRIGKCICYKYKENRFIMREGYYVYITDTADFLSPEEIYDWSSA